MKSETDTRLADLDDAKLICCVVVAHELLATDLDDELRDYLENRLYIWSRELGVRGLRRNHHA